MAGSREKKESTGPAKDQLIMQDHSQTFTFERPLGNRGQAGRAGFYTNESGDTVVIKEDPLSTCVMECSLGFIKAFLPEGHKECINLSECKIFENNEKKTILASIQPAIQNVKPWAIVLFRSQRNPKSPISIEYMNQSTLLNKLESLNNTLKTDLAVSLWASIALGDESLHTGQFLIVYANDAKKRKNKPIHLALIDRGAAGRGAVRLMLNNEDTTKTSYTYKWGIGLGIPQLYNHYIEYYLMNPDVNAKYIQLCLQQRDIRAFATQSKDCLHKSIHQIPKEEQQKTLWNIYKKILTVKCSSKEKQQLLTQLKQPLITNKSDTASLTSAILAIQERVAEERLTRMQRYAKIAVEKSIDELKSILTPLQIDENIIKTISPIITTGTLDQKNGYKQVSEAILQISELCQLLPRPDNTTLLSACDTVLAHMYAVVQFHPHEEKEKILLLTQIKLLQECIKFKIHLLKLTRVRSFSS